MLNYYLYGFADFNNLYVMDLRVFFYQGYLRVNENYLLRWNLEKWFTVTKNSLPEKKMELNMFEFICYSCGYLLGIYLYKKANLLNLLEIEF